MELKPPSKLNYFFYNPTVIYDKNSLLFFARISNRSFLPSADIWGSNRQRNKVEKTVDGVCSFLVDNKNVIKNFKICIPPKSVPCFQDPKAFKLNNEIVLFGNFLMKEPQGVDRKSIIRVSMFNTTNGNIKVFKKFNNRDIEKNWIPFGLNGNILTLIYESKPHSILQYNLITDETKLRIFSDIVERNYHGGSQIVEIKKDTFVRVVRHKFRFPYLGLIPISFVIVYDKNLKIKFMSRPFIFRKLGLEICNGLTISGDRLVFAWGEDDHRMFTGSIRITDFMHWLYSPHKSEQTKLNIFRKKNLMQENFSFNLNNL